MKKTLLLSALLASVSAIAATTGTVKVLNDSTTTLTAGEELVAGIQKTETTPKVVLDMKVKDTGFSFGGEALLKEITPLAKEITPLAVGGIKLSSPQGNVWAKYELPEIKGVKSYVKGTFAHTDKNLLTLEADANYNYEGYLLGLNSVTELPVFKTANVEAGDVTSTYTASVSKEKLSVLSDVKGSAAVAHSYVKEGFKSVDFKFEGQYKEVKDLNVKGEVEVKYNHENGAEYKSIDGLKTVAEGEKSVLDTYKLTAEYKGVKDLTLTGVGEIKHFAVLETTPKHLVEYGLDLKAEYMPVENLTLTANGLFYGQHNATGNTLIARDKKDVVEIANENNGYVKLVAGAKYGYKVTDKFTVTPEGTMAYTAANIDFVPAEALSTLVLTPKVSAEYKVSEDLTFGGSVETPVKFSNVKAEDHTKETTFGYKGTTVKTNLNLKYTW